MTIDPTVRARAKVFGVDAALVQAVMQAEGGQAALIRAVQCSLPSVQTFTEAVDVVCRSAAHAMSDYIKGSDPLAFVRFWGQRWAPVGAANDPMNQNANWVGNVEKVWSTTV